jgi:L-aminopeptidase/D-esterase-like protein
MHDRTRRCPLTRPIPVAAVFRLGVAALFVALWLGTVAGAQEKPRARDLGIPFDGTPGPLNAITDVAGIEVGHFTKIEGSGARVVGQGPVRTGVTAIWPRGKQDWAPVFGGWFSLNGNGEMTGTTWVKESGFLEGPFMITNTLSVGIVHHAVIRWGVEHAPDSTSNYPPSLAALPVVGETWDGPLNDILGQHLTEEDALAALADAKPGRVVEGAVGGGTGMECHEFKGGIGTSSRRVTIEGETYTVGVLVQCNYGLREQLRIAGVPVGREITDLMPQFPNGETVWAADGGLSPRLDPRVVGRSTGPDPQRTEYGSIIVLTATDAPLLPHQLERIARRIGMGLARNGSVSSNGSGDIFMAISTAGRDAIASGDATASVQMLENGRITPLFEATIQATEEAIVNAMVAAETMTGADDITVFALPHERVREVLRRYNRLEE